MAETERPRSKLPGARVRRRRRLRRVSVLRLLFLLLVYGLSLGAASFYMAILEINKDLPEDLTKLLDYRPYRKSVVLATDGAEIGTFSIENRRIVPLDRMPPQVPAAFISAEDGHFYQHPGFDLGGMLRAAWKNWRATGIKQGGSTITQQIIKQTVLAGAEGDLSELGLDPDTLAHMKKMMKYRRKMNEVVLAVRLERELTKPEILSIYLNHAYLGHGAYGVGAAAETYFGKEVEDLTIAEAAMLAGLVKSPTKYAPHNVAASPPRASLLDPNHSSHALIVGGMPGMRVIGWLAATAAERAGAGLGMARERQIYVLGRMREDHYISDAEYSAALTEPIALVDQSDVNHLASPYFVEYIREQATKRFGNNQLFKGGLTFYSTLDTGVQSAAEAALRHGLESLDRKLGFRGPIGTVAQAQRGAWTNGPAHPLPGVQANQPEDVSALAEQLLPEQRYGAMVVEEKGQNVVVDLGPKRLPLEPKDAKDVLEWRGDPVASAANRPPPVVCTGVKAHLKCVLAPAHSLPVRLGDLLAVRLGADGTTATLAQRPALQGSMIVMDPHTGRVLALVGGYDWTGSQFDRATQAKRQVGSSIKPFIYSAALEAGMTPVEHMHDGPFSVTTATGVWTPANYDNKYLGDVTLMTALAFSLNTISVQLAVRVGLDRIIEIMRGYGITSPIPRHISISLGTPDLTPLEVATAYAGIANGGRRVTPRFYDLVTDTTGHVVEDLRQTPLGPQIISPEVDYVMVNMMKGVVQRGTARWALGLGRPTAGKTGTSANYKDVWFNGFTTDLLCSVWIGRDDSTPIGDKITGGGAAVPIWLELMQKAHPPTSVRDFAPPPNVTFARVEPWGGDPTGPSKDVNDAVWMPFVRGSLPAPFLSGPRIRSFDDVVPAPAVPRPPASEKCGDLSCL